MDRSAAEFGRSLLPTSEAKPTARQDEKSSEPVKAFPTISSTAPGNAPVLTAGTPTASTQFTSPNKRRNSEAQHEGGSAAESVPMGSPKRAKPESPPAKVLPFTKYELCRVEDIVVLIAHMLGELIETNDALALKSGHLTRFHSR